MVYKLLASSPDDGDTLFGTDHKLLPRSVGTSKRRIVKNGHKAQRFIYTRKYHRLTSPLLTQMINPERLVEVQALLLKVELRDPNTLNIIT